MIADVQGVHHKCETFAVVILDAIGRTSEMRQNFTIGLNRRTPRRIAALQNDGRTPFLRPPIPAVIVPNAHICIGADCAEM
jgi:hypothetical protein